MINVWYTITCQVQFIPTNIVICTCNLVRENDLDQRGMLEWTKKFFKKDFMHFAQNVIPFASNITDLAQWVTTEQINLGSHIWFAKIIYTMKSEYLIFCLAKSWPSTFHTPAPFSNQIYKWYGIWKHRVTQNSYAFIIRYIIILFYVPNMFYDFLCM